jgi:translocation and assembly module TamB
MSTQPEANTDTDKDAAAPTVASPVPLTPPVAPASSPDRSVLRRMAAVLGALSAVSLSALLGPLVLAAALWGLWAWTGTPGSLGTALNMVHWALPSGQQLRSGDVQGNLQQGGRIGQISWQSGGLQVQAQDAQLVLDWSQLWRQAWPLKSLQIKNLRVQDQRPPQPLTPLTELRLPLPLQLVVQVDQLNWQGRTVVTLSDVRAQYAYDGQEHRLDVDSLALAQGRYTLQARLQGAAPMALHIAAQGQVQTPASGRTPALQLQVQSTVQGQLSGSQAQLSVQAELAPTPGQGALGRAQDKVHLKLQAQIQPWQEQAVVQAEGQWQALDLAPLWPGTPQTRLQGQARLMPDGQAWQLDAQMENLLPGAWDLKRLPLTQLSVKARHAQGLWQIQQAGARLGAGQVQGQGQQTPQGWTGQLDIQNLQPGLLHSAWAGPALQGRLKAEATGADTIALSADLQAQKAPPPTAPTNTTGPAALQWEQLQLTGQWHPDRWDIDSLRLQAAKAVLEGQFRWQPAQESVQGRMTLQLPGMQASAQGNLAPMTGQGRLDVQMQDAALSQTWLQGLPGWGAPLQTFKAFKASGPAQLQAQWQGGFAQADAPLSLSLQWPRIDWAQASPNPAAASRSSTLPAPWFLAPGQLKMQGSPLAVQAELQARLGQGPRLAQLQTTWRASRGDVRSPNWQGRIDQLELSTPNTQTPSAAPWRLTLQPTLAWQARLDQMALTWGPSNWLLQGPGPGNPRLQAEAGAWTAPASGQPVQTHGALSWSDLPAAWAQAWLGTDLLNEITLQGQAQWRMDRDLNLSVTAERSRGDLRIQTDSASGQTTAAGLRQAKVFLRVQNEQLMAELNWDTAQMGQAQAQLKSQLSRTPEGWQWAEQAPLSGTVQASLPQIGAWSVLAPPGWRVQGTLDASLSLSGTRSQPQWQGRLQADQLAVRSAVQGIEFSQGQMQARLQGQSLVLESLSLRGAGAQGGELQARGRVQFNPKATANPQSNPLRTADLALQIEAKNLRVSNRADRRLSVSGDVTARMAQGQLQLRGGLKADQALFILPEGSTPSLGDDVVVFRPDMGELNLSALSAPPDPNAPSSSWLGVPDVRVMLDLGQDFQLQGQGLVTRLAGQVELLSNASTRGLPRLSGQVRTEGGRYKAYGQQLNIDTGVLRFNGPYDNPSLDIIALRPNLPQKVGVQITGTALLPRIRLYADPDLPDADKLAWLVLGRSAANGGAESAVLQQAAVALLGGNGKTLTGELANSLGLDEISLASGSRSDASATGAAVTLGKRLSKDFYLAYETSLSGAFGSLYIFYDLSRRLTLRAQAGEQSALDLIFTVRRD